MIPDEMHDRIREAYKRGLMICQIRQRIWRELKTRSPPSFREIVEIIGEGA